MVNLFKRSLQKEEMPDYEYQIYVDGKLVWRGLNPEEVYENTLKENPDKKVSIAWNCLHRILMIPSFVFA